MSKIKNNEIQSIINFDGLVDTTIQKLLNDDEYKNNLSTAQIKTLQKITPMQIKILVEALKLSAKDGLHKNEAYNIINDLYDLVEEASSKKTFDKLMKNPDNPKFKLTAEVSGVLKNLKSEDRDQLMRDLEAQAPILKDKVLGFFNEIQSAAFPVVKSVIIEVVSLALLTLGKLINDSIDNPTGDILENGLKNLSLNIKNYDETNKDELIGETLEHPS